VAGQPWRVRIEAVLRALVELFAAEVEIIRMAMVEVTAVGEEARIRYRAALGRFTASFAIGGATSLIFDEVRAGRGPKLRRRLPDLVFAVLMP
jgi:hypothetical protein